MTDSSGLNAPHNRQAVIVLKSGVTVSLRLRKRERYEQKRTASQGKLETGYKISDGTVTDSPSIEVEGIITGSYNKFIAYNDIAASSEVASIKAAFEVNELVSVYTSFNALANGVFTSFKAEMVPGKKCISISLSAQGIRFANFSRTAGAPPKAKTSSAAGQGISNSGKKSVTPVKKPQYDILYFGERA